MFVDGVLLRISACCTLMAALNALILSQRHVEIAALISLQIVKRVCRTKSVGGAVQKE
jgi:hypothetical protein